MYEMASSFLREKGYSHYEISNYCLPRYISLHNMNYWRRGEYLGFGPAAHSFHQGKRQSNVAEVMRYCELIERGLLPVDSVTVPTPEEAIKETIFLGLRTRQGINLGDIIQMRGAGKEGSVSEDAILTGLSLYFDRGLIAFNKGMLHLTEKGFPLSNTLIVEVMRKLRL
jgi:oxygen-independent coproporphyrinogen-3 oxidase